MTIDPAAPAGTDAREVEPLFPFGHGLGASDWHVGARAIAVRSAATVVQATAAHVR